MINNNSVFLVGGAVRDILLGIDPKDKDYVVVGHTEEEMLSNGFEQVGKDFPVFLHPKTRDEYALARKERKTGLGYNGFEVEIENVTLEDDLFRRDLTINAMAMTNDGQLIDPYGGENDLKNRTLKHVSKHFSEDPVRILRISRFSARYDFKIHEDTIVMLSEMVRNGEFDNLTSERVWKEFEKVLNERHLVNFFDNLEKIGALSKISGFSSIKDKTYFDFIQKNSNNIFSSNLLHTFSQMSKQDLQTWRMPSDEQQKIVQFKTWKDKEINYSQMNVDDRLSFIQLNRAMQQIEKAKEIIYNINLYNSWRSNISFNPSSDLNSFENDILKLKTLDYEQIVQQAKIEKIKPNDLIKTYQVQALQQKKKFKL